MHPRTPGSFTLLIAALTLAVTDPCLAQTVPPSASAEMSRTQQPIELSPFVVDESRDIGYLATSTLAGSRFNTALKDTPASISVMTQEFLSDIGAFQLSDAMAFGLNVEFDYDDSRQNTNEFATFYNYQTFRVRGLPASVARNYFGWDRAIPDEAAFIDRIEDSRGPNSVLFGIASPGGVINVSTKQAQFGRAINKASFSYGSYDSKRSTLEFNRTLFRDKLAARLILVYNRNNEFRHFAYEEHLRGLLSVKYNLGTRTVLRADFERGEYQSNPTRSGNLMNRFLVWNSLARPTFAVAPPASALAASGLARFSTATTQPRVTYLSNNDLTISMRGALSTAAGIPAGQQGIVSSTGIITDRTISDYSINVGGPGQDRFSRFGLFDAFLEHRFSKTTVLELAYHHVDMSLDSRDPRGGDFLYGDPNQLLPNGAQNPNAGRVYLETTWFRTVRRDQGDTGRITFTTELDAKRWGHYRFAALGEFEKSFIGSNVYQEYWLDSATGRPAFNIAVPENAANQVFRRTYPTEGDWSSYYIVGPVGSAGGLLNGVRDPVTGRTLSSTWYAQNYPSQFYYRKKSGMAVLQARYLRDRLIVAGGVRRDDLTEHQLGGRRNPVTNIREITHNPAESDPARQPTLTRNLGTTKTLGLVYHLTPIVSVNYNRSDNLETPGKGYLRLPASGEPGDPLPVPPPEGRGEDVGLGVDLFRGKLSAKATYYTVRAANQATSSPPIVRTTNTDILTALQSAGLITQADFDRRSDTGAHGLFDFYTKGWEVQVTANLTKNWRFQGNFATADAVSQNTFLEWMAWSKRNSEFLSSFRRNGAGDIVDGAGNPLRTTTGASIAEAVALYQDELKLISDTDGIGKLGNRKQKVSVVTRYSFDSGMLKGSYVGGAYRHQSKMFTGVDAGLRPVYGNSYWELDLMAGYVVPLLRHKARVWSFQLNVFNVTNERQPLAIRFDAYGAIMRDIVRAPTTWRLSTNLEF